MGLSVSAPSLLFRRLALGGSAERLTYSGCNDTFSWAGEECKQVVDFRHLRPGLAVPPRRAEKLPLMRSHLDSPIFLSAPTGIIV